MLPSFANLVTEALPLDRRVQRRLGGVPRDLKINSNAAGHTDIDLKKPNPYKYLDKQHGKKYLFKNPFIEVWDIQIVCQLVACVTLIANTDRHHGNVSLLLHQYNWQLAPAYDMLPMFYTPVVGEVVVRNWGSQLPRPNANTLSVWPQAKALALQFWQSAAADARISHEFRAVAKANEGLVNDL